MRHCVSCAVEPRVCKLRDAASGVISLLPGRDDSSTRSADSSTSGQGLLATPLLGFYPSCAHFPVLRKSELCALLVLAITVKSCRARVGGGNGYGVRR